MTVRLKSEDGASRFGRKRIYPAGRTVIRRVLRDGRGASLARERRAGDYQNYFSS
jgi:hypothetical protein